MGKDNDWILNNINTITIEKGNKVENFEAAIGKYKGEVSKILLGNSTFF